MIKKNLTLPTPSHYSHTLVIVELLNQLFNNKGSISSQAKPANEWLI
jgi:hypothetical protein